MTDAPFNLSPRLRALLLPPPKGGIPIARVDFETLSECDLRAHGAWRYSKHPSTRVFCLMYQIEDGPVKPWISDVGHEKAQRFPADLGHHIATGGLVEAHNYFFEKCIWTHILTPQYSWPQIPDDNWRCTAALASRHNLPRSLDNVCKALRLPIKKDSEGHKLMIKLSKPRKPTKDDPSTWSHLTSENLERLYAYCVQDVLAEGAVAAALPPLEPRELALWQFTERLNWRGVYVDLDFARRAVTIFAALKRDAEKRVVGLTNGVVTTLGQRDRILEWCRGRGVDMANLQKETVQEVLGSSLPDDVFEILESRTHLAKGASISKYKAMLDRADLEDGRLRDHVGYFRAGPGRWAGQGVQTQNLPNKVDLVEAREFMALAKSLTRPTAMRLTHG